ncbi:MAG: type II toxin-antitoxin system HicA family toxin [Candidatus Methanofastidiosia archaeon]
MRTESSDKRFREKRNDDISESMSQLPVISGKKLVKTLKKCGYYVRDQKGSHIHLRHPTKPPLTIPNHKAIARGTMKLLYGTQN